MTQKEGKIILVVMIPAYNEEKTISDVIKNIPRDIRGIDDVRILVIDDGSNDKTVEKAILAGADKIISNKKNVGLAKTFKVGLNKSLEMNADIIVNIDADNQYDPKEIPKLILPILESRADIVLGDRQINKLDHMSFSKKIGNRIATWITRKLSGYPVKDAQTGFRAFSREAALKLNILGNYTYVQETIIQATHKDLVIEEVPVVFKRREGESRLISNIFSYAKNAAIAILRTYRDYNPIKTFAIIGIIFIIISFIPGFVVLKDYFATGTFSGHIGRGLLTILFFFIGVQIIIFGLLADILKTQRQLQEEILYKIKKGVTK